MASSDEFQLFNLETMSGVFPGTRTMVFQRVRVQPLGQPTVVPRWARILWYDEPPACIVETPAVDHVGYGGANQELDRPATEPETSMGASGAIRLPDPLRDDLVRRLIQALDATGWQVRICATCVHWRRQTATTADSLPTGCCTWQPAGPITATAPAPLAIQSGLALDCPHWSPAAVRQDQGGPATDTCSLTLAAQTSATCSLTLAAQTSATCSLTLAAQIATPLRPIRKRAEQDSDERWTWWGRLRRRVHRSAADSPVPANQDVGWEERIIERSGVGAGTEACFACQGRIANLGALTVATPEGDKQTYSVWRCRQCYTYYLNDWIDRWERTDSLETEETYYRVSPAEALDLLAVFDNVVHAEHPARRHERFAQREWVIDFIGGRTPLSHQTKQGR